MTEINSLIGFAREQGASDIHLSAGPDPVVLRVNGRLGRVQTDLGAEQVSALLLGLLDGRQRQRCEDGGDVDFALETPDGKRQRVNLFHSQGCLAATIRLLNDTIPELEALGLPPVLRTLAEKPRGLVLVTGPTGSGKSTTLAAMIDHINHTRAEHVITVEDPVEYLYRQDRCLIHQREVGRDVEDFASALRSALREDPDIILVGEMRDYETISAALTAAETGHLVLSTLHTTGAAQTIDRIIDGCPGGSQNQVRTQLAGVLAGVVTQCLIPRADASGRVAATEILTGTDAVLNLIRENKCHQLGTSMQSGMQFGMHTLNADLARLVGQGTISRENAYQYSNNRKELEQFLD